MSHSPYCWSSFFRDHEQYSVGFGRSWWCLSFRQLQVLCSGMKHFFIQTVGLFKRIPHLAGVRLEKRAPHSLQVDPRASLATLFGYIKNTWLAMGCLAFFCVQLQMWTNLSVLAISQVFVLLSTPWWILCWLHPGPTKIREKLNSKLRAETEKNSHYNSLCFLLCNLHMLILTCVQDLIRQDCREGDGG